MATVTESRIIRAAPERVFQYRLNVTNLPFYNTDVFDLRALREGPPREGSVFRFRVRLKPLLSVHATLTIREVDAPKRLVFEIASLMNAREVCTFESVADGTRVCFETTVQTPGGRLASLVVDRAFVVPNARTQLARELTLMKEHLERA
jgi:uncharacterized protein YndB with AHSA1/START domain